MGPQCWGGAYNLGRERAVIVVGEQAQRAEGRRQRAEGRRQDTVNVGAILLAAPMSKKRTLHSRPSGLRVRGQSQRGLKNS